MKQNLLDCIEGIGSHEVLAESYLALCVVAKPRAAHRPVKTKRVVDDAVALKKAIS